MRREYRAHEIARRWGCHRSTVVRRMAAAGIRGRKGGRADQSGRIYTWQEIRQAERMQAQWAARPPTRKRPSPPPASTSATVSVAAAAPDGQEWRTLDQIITSICGILRFYQRRLRRWAREPNSASKARNAMREG